MIKPLKLIIYSLAIVLIMPAALCMHTWYLQTNLEYLRAFSVGGHMFDNFSRRLVFNSLYAMLLTIY